MNQLEQLRQYTTVVADTGDFESIKKYKPQDATTNPTLIAQAAKKTEYRYILEKALRATKHINSQQREPLLLDHIFVGFGLELLQIVPGRVSTEVDAKLSFDTKASIERARHIISLYEAAAIPRERILIKLAATWEGIRAAEVLEMEDIHCNLTLLFSLPQAIACAEARVTLLSPFVGRILDWYTKSNPQEKYLGETDPGVLSVREIYSYFKKFDYPTEIMGASFRNKEEILALAGCDLLTISPKFLEEMQTNESLIERKLSPSLAKESAVEKREINEALFRFMFNENPMAVEKLSEGIRLFAKDMNLLKKEVDSLQT